MTLTTKSILETLSDEWQPLISLVLKLKLRNMYDARFLHIKLKEFERKNLILSIVKKGRKHWKLTQVKTDEKLTVYDYFDSENRKFDDQIKIGIISQYSNSVGTYELFLPVDTSYLKSEMLVNMFKDIRPIIGITIWFNKKLVSINNSKIFHKGFGKFPYCWNVTLNKAVEPDLLNQIIEEFHYIPYHLTDQSHSINRSQINPDRYGMIVRNTLFSYGDYELLLPLELSCMKDDSLHQSVKQMLKEINPLAGFSFISHKKRNLLLLFDDMLFGDWYEEWNLKMNSFAKDLFDLTDFSGEENNSLASGILVFISYSTRDSKEFKIPYISEELEKFPEIEKALYWEEDVEDDIFEYMNKYIKECDVFILICSQSALDSEPVNMEWQAALKIKKKIIPIFKNEDDIPVLLTTKLGIKYNEQNFEKTVNDLYYLIKKKLKKKIT